MFEKIHKGMNELRGLAHQAFNCAADLVIEMRKSDDLMIKTQANSVYVQLAGVRLAQKEGKVVDAFLSRYLKLAAVEFIYEIAPEDALAKIKKAKAQLENLNKAITGKTNPGIPADLNDSVQAAIGRVFLGVGGTGNPEFFKEMARLGAAHSVVRGLTMHLKV